MPTRRIMVVAALTALLIFPVTRVVHQWGRKAAAQPDGTLSHSIGETVVILT